MTWATAALALVGIGLALLLLALRRSRRRARRRAVEHLAGRDPRLVDERADFFGLSSRGAGQVRGSGVLTLTDHSLWFRMLLPERELEIPLHAVVEVGTTQWHLGKSVFRPLLRVTFRRPEGGEDAAAWSVSRLEDWLEALGRTA